MAEIFPAGDPRNALYNETLAGINFAEESSLAGIKEGLAHKEAENTFAEGEQTRVEPGTFRGIDSRSNSQGLLESGVETRRTGDQTADFAAKRSMRQQSLKEAREGGLRREGETRHRGEVERGTAGKRAESENFSDIQNNPGLPPGATSPYGTPATVFGPPGPGGVVPREYTSPGGGKVRIGPRRPR